MTLQNKTSRLRAVATKVALGLGIALVASSIAPMAVAPASATAPIVWFNDGYSMTTLAVVSSGSVTAQDFPATTNICHGYGRFLGWSSWDQNADWNDSVNSIDVLPNATSYTPSANTELFAVCGWELTFDLNGGSVNSNSGPIVRKYVYNMRHNGAAPMFTAPNPTRTGYVTMQYSPTFMSYPGPTADTTYVMQWQQYVAPSLSNVQLYSSSNQEISLSPTFSTSTTTYSATVSSLSGLKLKVTYSGSPVIMAGVGVQQIMVGSSGVYSSSFTGTTNTPITINFDNAQTYTINLSYTPYVPGPTTQTFKANGGLGSDVVRSGTSIQAASNPGHSDSSCNFLGWSTSSTATDGLNGPVAGNSYQFNANYTWFAVWNNASCRTAPQQNNNPAPAAPAPQLDLGGLKTIPAPSAGVTGGTAGINLEGKNLPTVTSVTVAGKDGKVVTSTDTKLKLDLPTMAPGSYDIVMKTAGNGSITIQNGLVIAPPVDTKPVEAVVLTPSVPRTKLVAAAAPVPGFVAGKAGVSEAQKAIVQDIVMTKNVTSLQCVGVTSAKVSSKLAAARAAAICAEAKAQNPALTTSVKTVAAAKVSGPVASVIVNYNH